MHRLTGLWAQVLNQLMEFRHQADYTERIYLSSRVILLKSKQIYQTVNVKGTEKSTYILSGWAKGNSVAANDQNSARKFELIARVNYSDGTTVYKSPAYFNTTVSSWQYTAIPFNLSDGTSTTKTPVSITVFYDIMHRQTAFSLMEFSLRKNRHQALLMIQMEM